MVVGTLLKHISDLVKYHIRNLTTLIEVWAKLEALYGAVDEDMAYTIDNKLLKLEPRNFDTIKDYLTQVETIGHNLRIVVNPSRMEK